ncbi:RNA polymerase factor sigma-54 [Gluconobacter cerinus]|uniref:RNA polymerase factor sigma-54 n=1 Tax=Gluconobacter cerinus TaxID=38307 RepID=UPI001B8CC95B|nr:RNA polymerase factor sigma-54 [Gluconobacter cerinus]MBS1039564.1 RNA polymerase factor sigma-54 [Gluconobacter cerinus]MBS1046261.1 RNA polymerase factor sigma-54 [Gluconobacter cerinus]
MLSPGLIQRQSQSLVMTPQLRQAIALLQLGHQELTQSLQQIAELNPLLILEATDTAPNTESADPASELHDDDPERFTSGSEQPETAAPGPTLHDDLIAQIHLRFPVQQDCAAALYLLACLDEAGRLPEAVSGLAVELGVEPAALETIRQVLMRLEPAGLFTRSLEECLAVQLEQKNRLDPAMKILLANLDLLARRDWRLLRQKCQLEQDDLLDMLAEIQALNPRPGFDPRQPVSPIQPDLILRKNGPGFRLTFNHRLLPHCHVDLEMQSALDSSTDAGRQLLAYANEANAVIRALEMRRQTILKIGAEIVRQQAAFFEEGLAALRPLTMRDLATGADVHESTVSRVVNGKYIDTPRGILPLRMFFSTALQASDGSTQSASAIQHRIKTLIASEGDDILSDDALTTQLQKEGFAIQRRTVAKYREGMGIAKSSQRRRLRKNH